MTALPAYFGSHMDMRKLTGEEWAERKGHRGTVSRGQPFCNRSPSPPSTGLSKDPGLEGNTPEKT